MLIIALGLINWFATYLIVESEFFKGYREWVDRRAERAERFLTFWFWQKIAYFKDCHACTGTWVGLALAPFAPAVFGPGILPFVLVALLVKAIGHLVLVVHKYGEALTEDLRLRRVYMRGKKDGS